MLLCDQITSELKGELTISLNEKEFYGDMDPTKNPTTWGTAVNFAQAKVSTTHSPLSELHAKSLMHVATKTTAQ